MNVYVHTLPLHTAPRIESSSPTEVEVVVGCSAILSCQVSSATPPTYEWRKNGQKISDNGGCKRFLVGYQLMHTLFLYR